MKKLAFVAATAAVLVTAPGLAQTSDRDIMEVLGKCAAITDAAQRLSCYDGAAPSLKSALIKPPTAIARAPTREEESSWFGFSLPNLFGGADGPQVTPQQFGSNTLSQQQRATIAGGTVAATAQPIDSISASVTEYALNPQGRYVLFLDNGQVWRQQGGDS